MAVVVEVAASDLLSNSAQDWGPLFQPLSTLAPFISQIAA